MLNHGQTATYQSYVVHTLSLTVSLQSLQFAMLQPLLASSLL